MSKLKVRTIDTPSEFKPKLKKVLNELVDQGYAKKNVVERSLISLQYSLGGHGGITTTVGMFIEKLKQSQSMGVTTNDDYVKTMHQLKGMSNNDTVVFIATEKGNNVNSLLVHELVHAEQLQQGRLVCDNSDLVTWEGSKMVNTHNPKDAGYYQLPWEAEAFERQVEYEATQYKLPLDVARNLFKENIKRLTK